MVLRKAAIKLSLRSLVIIALASFLLMIALLITKGWVKMPRGMVELFGNLSQKLVEVWPIK